MKTRNLLISGLLAGVLLVLMVSGMIEPHAYAEDKDSTSEGKRISFAGFDALAHVGEEIILKAKLETVLLRKDIEHEQVDFYVDEVFVGSSRTDDEGFALMPFTPEKTGDFNVVYKLPAASGYSPEKTKALLAVRTEERPALVTDLDYTLIDMSKYRFLIHDNKKIPPIEGALEGLKELAKRYDIIYLTARDDIYLNVTKDWLEMYGFPRAPVFFCDLSEDPLSQGKFKEKALKELKSKWPNIEVGIGDKVHDAEAYIAGGIKAFLLGRHESFPEGAIVAEKWSEICEALKK